jgi:hypothetical protein
MGRICFTGKAHSINKEQLHYRRGATNMPIAHVQGPIEGALI